MFDKVVNNFLSLVITVSSFSLCALTVLYVSGSGGPGGVNRVRDIAARVRRAWAGRGPYASS